MIMVKALFLYIFIGLNGSGVGTVFLNEVFSITKLCILFLII